uniref:Uncharacterized protein n=1 Tax=Medicago truncatula TaxID=3880 RepID=A2Q5S5_MEDTR|nr:hypothetical protein MtrDRAFT_AC168204g5v2 [Medicago truncatula]
MLGTVVLGKSCQRETNEVKHKNKGKKNHQSITCYDGWKTGLEATKLQSSTTLRIQLSTQVAYPRSRSNQIIHLRAALIKNSGSSNIRIKPTVLMTPWKHKLRIHPRH